jgi:CPA1 family monovalent cation:H+ antiporter
LVILATGQFNLAVSAANFVRVSAGGLAVGLILGWMVSRMISRIDDYLIETTLTTVLACGSYLIAEQLHFSGVLAVVAAGLINGNLGPQGMSPTTRIVLFNFWEYVAFLSNSLVFLLIGLEVDIPALLQAWQPILWAIAAVLVARVLVIYGLSLLSRRFVEPISLRWQHVMAWGGLRGALSLALALSLPETIGPELSLLRTMAFGVVVFTLLVQATSMRPLIRRLGIALRTPEQVEYETRHARLTALRSAEGYLDRQHREGLISGRAWEVIRPKLKEQIALLAEAVRESLQMSPTLEAEELETARREVLRAQRGAFLGLRQDGIIADEVYERLTAEMDAHLESGTDMFWFVPGESLPDRLRNRTSRVDVREVLVEADSACDGRHVKDLNWPVNSVIAGLRRNDELIIVRGQTILRVGDVLMLISDDEALQQIQRLAKSSVAQSS